MLSLPIKVSSKVLYMMKLSSLAANEPLPIGMVWLKQMLLVPYMLIGVV